MKIIEINLLPPEYAPPSPYSFRNIAIFVLSFLVAILLVFLTLQMVDLENTYKEQLKQFEANLERYGKQRQYIRDLAKYVVGLNQLSDILGGLVEQRVIWSNKLINLYEQIPENLWLSKIELERQKIELPKTTSKKGEKEENEQEKVQQFVLLHISGEALGVSEISRFIAQLDESQSFEKTKLISTTQGKKKGRLVRLFYITTQLENLIESPKQAFD